MKRLLILFFLVFLLAACETDTITVDGKDTMSIFHSDYISDENYEPEEDDLFQVIIEAFNDADKHDWDDFDDNFKGDKVAATDIADVYGVYERDPSKVERFTYEINNKQMDAYLDNVKVEPKSTRSSNGVTYKEFPYDVWLEFSFELVRHANYENQPTETDTFNVEGTMPAFWKSSGSAAHWHIQDLWVEPVNKGGESS